jgi:hypothetical protein
VAEAVDTLVKALNGIDASRRAGWAQKYAADARAEELSRDVNILSEQRDDLKRALSWLFGVSMALGRHTYDGDLFDALRQEVDDWEIVLDPVHIERGRARALSIDTQNGGTRARTIKSMRSERAKKLVQRQKSTIANKIARQWGFETYQDMRLFLIDLLGNPKEDPDFDNNVLREWAKAASEVGLPVDFIGEQRQV